MIYEKTPKRRTAGEYQTSLGYIRRQKWTNPVVAGNTGYKSAVTLGDGVTTTVLAAAITQPAFARTVRLKSNASSVDGLKVTISGTDIRGDAITEEVTMAATANPTDSAKAFKTITSILFPARGAGGDTISVGPGGSLGLDRKVSEDSALYATVDTVIESTRPVITDAATLAGCTVLISTALANNKAFVVAYVATEITGSSITTA